MRTLKYLILSMRPKQWTKNLLVFLPLIFTINLYWKPFDPAQVAPVIAKTAVAFLLFCLITGGAYIINDLVDIERDKEHPEKRFRPLPSGQLSTAYAGITALLLLIVGLALSFAFSPWLGIVASLYLLLMLAYDFVLKNIVIIDVFTIAIGFVLRAVAGAVAIDVPVSPWLYTCTLLGALFLGLGKRRHELITLEDKAANHRGILLEYTPRLLEDMIAVVTSSTIIAYSLYTFSAPNLPQNHAMMLTIPFVLYGVFRYLYLIHSKNLGGSPEEILLTDTPLIIDILLWAVAASVILFIYR